MSLSFHNITFTHDGAPFPLLEDVSAHFDAGWTGVVGANGTGKTTVLQLAAGLLEAEAGNIIRAGHMVICPQRTDHAPEMLADFLTAMEPEAFALRGRLGIGEDWAARWFTLSHGERKRAQIGTALWRDPDVLLIDEATNHIDADARSQLIDALRRFHGVGIIVSHDREVLDILCSQCLFLHPPDAVMRPGSYTQAAAEAQREAESAYEERQQLQTQLVRLKQESRTRHSKASQADRKRSKRGLARGDSDGRAKLDLARVTGKDGQAGRLARQLDGRIAQLEEKVAAVETHAQRVPQFWLEGSCSPRRVLFTLPSGEIDLGESRILSFPSLTMQRNDRIAITGGNGLGKSTFIRHILRELQIEEQHLVYLPQEIDLEQTRRIMSDVRALPNDLLGHVYTIVSTLGSDPKRLLQNDDASPGELRKILLALGVVRHPHLIVMDEPTNHLDLPAVECLEQALRDCPCGLLLVSHDMRFLSNVATTKWQLTQNGSTVSIAEELI